MSDITVTAASVTPGSGATVTNGTAGAAITAGQTVYLDASTNTVKLADCDLSAAAATVTGIALHAAASGQPIAYQTSGIINIGATVVAGKVYVNSATAGGIAPVADLTTNWRTSVLGVALTSSTINLKIDNTGVANA